MSKLRDRLTNPKDIERYDRNYNSCEVTMTQAELDRELVKAYNDGQAYILDKIRAEIEQGSCKVENDYDKGRNMGLHIAMQIIDKYRGDTDGKG